MFVEREAGQIKSAYARLQPGRALERLAEDDPELVAFLASVAAGPSAADEIDAAKDAWQVGVEGLLDELAAKAGLPDAPIKQRIKEKAAARHRLQHL